jgi:hypothetical protein
MPTGLLPKGRSFETEVDGRFQFDVNSELPLVGPIVRYQGFLQPS